MQMCISSLSCLGLLLVVHQHFFLLVRIEQIQKVFVDTQRIKTYDSKTAHHTSVVLKIIRPVAHLKINNTVEQSLNTLKVKMLACLVNCKLRTEVRHVFTCKLMLYFFHQSPCQKKTNIFVVYFYVYLHSVVMIGDTNSIVNLPSTAHYPVQKVEGKSCQGHSFCTKLSCVCVTPNSSEIVCVDQITSNETKKK